MLVRIQSLDDLECWPLWDCLGHRVDDPEVDKLLNVQICWWNVGLRTRLDKPWVVGDRLDVRTLLRIDDKYFTEQIRACRRDKCGDIELTGPNLLVKPWELFVVKRESSTEHRVENDSGRPDVHLWSIIFPARENFWSNVRRRPAGGFEFRVLLRQNVGKSEVDDFQIVLTVQQNILQL